MNNFSKISREPRFSRTMQEAFGPYTSHLISDDSPQTDWDGVAIVVGCIVAVVIVYAWMWGGV